MNAMKLSNIDPAAIIYLDTTLGDRVIGSAAIYHWNQGSGVSSYKNRNCK